MDTLRRSFMVLCLLVAPAISALGGGSGLNIVIVVNQNSSNSIALGNYYRELRQVPPQNIFRMTGWTGAVTDWTRQQFTNALLNPLNSFLAQRVLTNQVDYLLLSMDIPYRVIDGANIDSTTSTLYYGFKTNDPPPGAGLPASCSLPDASANPFAGSETPFRNIAPGSLSANNLMATMITANNLELARATVYQGVISDSSFPTQTVYLVKSTDADRNIRYKTFDRAIFDTRVRGNYSMARTNLNAPSGLGPMLGLQTGLFTYSTAALAFVPGALADNLTSYGGAIFQNTGGHLNILSLLAAGAAGSYGTVDEPCAYLEKFPSPQTYFYQARGFTLAEAYYQGVTNPYQGLLMGDPLSAPFALPPTVYWTNISPDQVLSGIASLSMRALSGSAELPVSSVDLFTNGTWMTTLTNIPPAQGNRLTVNVGSRTVTYSVPASASVKTVATGLTAALNNAAAQTKVKAVLRGDRIELRLTDRSQPPDLLSLGAQSALGTAQLLTTHLHGSRSNFLVSVAHGIRQFQVEGNPTNRWLSLAVTKTNGQIVAFGVTNTASLARLDFVQTLVDAVNAHPDLSGPDGLVAEDLVDGGADVTFNLRARSASWDAAQIQAKLTAQTGLTVTPSTLAQLDDNLDDLQPRNHLYVSAGLTNFTVNFSLNTATLGDGSHELTATATDGTHVQTQARTPLNVIVRNGFMEASLVTLVGGTNAALEATLQFSVTANDPAVNRIELFGTGGSLGVVTGAPSATFQVSGATLGPGLHPFYAVATGPGGLAFRTATKWISLVGEQPPPPLSITGPASAPALTWPAAAGRTYSILGTTNLSITFQPIGTVTPTNETAYWSDPTAPSQTRFYRVRSN